MPSRVRGIRLLWLSWLLSWPATTGCGPALYASRIDDAEARFAQATEENARWYAPYEYHFASAHLQKAREEAADACYEEALRFARTAEDFSRRALEITQQNRAIER